MWRNAITEPRRHCLLMVVNDQETVHDVLAALMEQGITTATVIESQGMGSIVAEQMPIFAGFRNLWGGASSYNTTIFTVIENDILDETLALLREVMIEAPERPRGVLFTVPVDNFIAPRRDRG